MDPSTVRSRLRDDLRRQFRGDLLIDGPSRTLFSSDSSLFHIEPLAVAMPRDVEDLRLLVRYAYDRALPIVPRGAGTGLAGESLGHGLIIDLSVYFRDIIETGDDWVRVQPGVVLNRLNAHLAQTGRRFAPDPANSMSCTIGGMIATDASGSRAIAHGYTRDHVRGLGVVWDDGSADNLTSQTAGVVDARAADLREGLRTLLQTHAEPIAASRRKPPFNRCGYRLGSINGSAIPDILPLLVGSEGTLAITTEATLRTISLPGGRAAVAIGFSTFEAALQAGLAALETHPSACEVLDRRLLSHARMQSSQVAGAMGHDVETILLVEYERDSPDMAGDAVRMLIDRLQTDSTASIVSAFSEGEVADLWAVRSSAFNSLNALGRGRRPLAFVENIGVAPSELPAFVQQAKDILHRNEMSATTLIDCGTGHVQLRPILDPDRPDEAARLWPLAEELNGLALALGGTVSARHGIGLARTPWVERESGAMFPVFREVKRLFDPKGILNPGKIVGPDPSRPAWPLRKPMAPPLDAVALREPTTRALTPLLVWDQDEMPVAIAACNGCGACRTESPGQRMCPVFQATHSEAAAPRAKANLFRSLLDTGISDDNADAVRAVADLCVNCKMCASECPGRADIPKLMLEAKAAAHAAIGLRRSAWFLVRVDGLAAFGSKMSLTANVLLRRPTFRWLMEKLFGLARRRVLPAFAFRTFLARARRKGWTKRPAGGPGVAYFVDTYANLFDPGLAEATIAVLRHNGVPAYVPWRQRGCGAFALVQGDTDVARDRLLYNVRRLAEAARAGDTIVCSEPTAAVFFRIDALGLSNEPDVKLVASRTVELSTFLWSLHEQGRLRTDFLPLDLALGHHVPCHVKALGPTAAGPALLSLIPGLTVRKIDLSCSGMAGVFGLNAHNFPVSMAAGRPMLEEFARPDHQYGSSECSACRMQMQQGAGKRALHPILYLAMAYGLMTSVGDRLRRPLAGLVDR